MADLGQIFDPAEVPEDNRSFDPLPMGDYLCQILESDVVKTKAGDGEILKLTLEVVDGPYERRRIFETLNIRNPNPNAQAIAQRALADLCQACGLGVIRDSEELHFKPFLARVAIETDKTGQYEPKNRVKRYKPARGTPPTVKSGPTAVPSANQTQMRPSRPWGLAKTITN
jgi:hypothetical protein